PSRRPAAGGPRRPRSAAASGSRWPGFGRGLSWATVGEPAGGAGPNASRAGPAVQPAARPGQSLILVDSPPGLPTVADRNREVDPSPAMNKIKSHKGLLKRIKVTRNGKVKHQPAGARHRKSLNSQRQNRQLRHEKVAPKVEARRIYQA